MRKAPQHGDGAWLKTAREEMGLSQDQMAALLGITQPALSHYETGRNKRLGKLARREVVRLLGMTTAQREALLTPAAVAGEADRVAAEVYPPLTDRAVNGG